ncbi:putative endonuclease [Tenacibaculum sp. MAR_2009_124]|uniref:GIY-YIG nuclease family protein n=1 Tax=Tenacibaculum sp. MAR_2009_124 TaxID=1250059 RepID=UPI0008955676|nr:GIY-YIG nuclease family protein [Tenacibaculum sp. MAR_2009_124]SEC41176.1 putative endonuclease [Tenacibaculum sp. MAR_2009_124]
MLTKYFIYILTNRNKTTLYIGVTNNLQRRLSEHYFDSQNSKKTFAGKYNCFNLIYYEIFRTVKEAIMREKEIKKWNRTKKESLISSFNPEWLFLNKDVF